MTNLVTDIERSAVEIDYVARNGSETRRTITPIRLLAGPNGPLLSARTADGTKSFATEGIIRVVDADGEILTVRDYFLRTAAIDIDTVEPRPWPSRPRPAGTDGQDVVVFTGQLAGMTRAQAVEVVRRRGGRCSDTVTADTTYLVHGTGMVPSKSKLAKATQLGVAVLDEVGFMVMFGEEE